MRIVISILATLIIIFSLMQCKKTGDQIVISGYLAMDDNGNYVQGQPYDADDWGSNKSIPSSIEALLKSLPAQFSPAVPYSTQSYPKAKYLLVFILILVTGLLYSMRF